MPPRKRFAWFTLPADLVLWASCAVTFLMMAHVSVDVVARVVFNHPLDGTIEIVSGYYMVAVTFLPLAYVTWREGHIIVELFTRNLPPPKLKRLDGIVNIATLAYIVLFTWASVSIAVFQTGVGELWMSADSFIAIWPSRWVLAVGCFLMAVYLLVRIVQDLRQSPP